MSGNLFAAADGVGSDLWYSAWCDGGSRGNPGPSGYGAVIQNPDGQTVARLSQFLGIQTNNFAEYQGLLAVLDWALSHDVHRLRVVSDSELMVKQMNRQYKVASPSLRPLWEEALRRAARLKGFEMQHTLRGGNKEADRLANEAMDAGMRKPASRQQGSESASQHIAGPARPSRSAAEPAPSGTKVPRRVLDGYVKNGVVHVVEGELAEGTFVKIVLD